MCMYIVVDATKTIYCFWLIYSLEERKEKKKKKKKKNKKKNMIQK